MSGLYVTSRGRGVVAAFCAVIGLSGFGCGDDKSKTDLGGPGTILAAASGSGGAAGTAQGGVGGATAGVAAAGAGGAGGVGRAGSGGSVAAEPPPPVVCGGETCTLTSMRLQACCLPEGGCGLGTGGECQMPDQPGSPDPTCPAHEVTSVMLTLEGCCRPDNQCGVMSASGLGCVERTQLATFAGGPLEAQSCVSTDSDGGVDVDSDAGAPDSTDDPDAEEMDAGVDDEAAETCPPWPPRPRIGVPPWLARLDAGAARCPTWPPFAR
jgi:hypothetical protein